MLRRTIQGLTIATSVAHLAAGCTAEPTTTPPPPDGPCAPTRFGPETTTADLGFLETLAGEGGAGYVDGSDPRTNGVGGIARLADGRLVLSDVFNGTLRIFDPEAKTMSTALGFPLQLGATDGVCSDVRLGGPRGITVDPRDDDVVLFGDGPCLRQAALATGTVVTIAGDCDRPGDVDGIAGDARFGFLFHDLEATDDGRVFIADRVNDSIRVVDRGTGTVSTLARGFDGPGAMALDGRLLYVADTFNNTIRTVDTDSGTVTLIAGRPGIAGSDDGPAGTATFDAPQAIALIDETLFVAGFDGVVRQIDVIGGTVSTLVRLPTGFFAPFVVDGDGVVGADLDGLVLRLDGAGVSRRLCGPRAPVGFADGSGVEARFTVPASVAVAADHGSVYVGDGQNNALREVQLDTGRVATLAGGPDHSGDVDGDVAVARLGFPSGVAVSRDGNTIFFADTTNGSLRRFSFDSNDVVTVAAGLLDPWEIALDEDRGVVDVVSTAGGTVVEVAIADGTSTTVASGLNVPVGLALVDGRLFVSENEGHVVREIDRTTGATTVILGTVGFQGSADGSADVALLNFPAGLDGRLEGGVVVLYLAETGGQTIRRIDVATGESRFIVGDPFLSGALPAGARVVLDGAPILNPNDVVMVADDVIIVGDTTVSRARP